LIAKNLTIIYNEKVIFIFEKAKNGQTDRQTEYKNCSASSLTPHVVASDQRECGNRIINKILRFFHRFIHRNDSFIKKAGFTLAEVLLVMTIIGIVASYTIPDLIQNIQSQQYKAALNKTYSVLSSATSNVAEENGGNLAGLPVVGSSSHSLISYYYKYLNVIKKCTYDHTRGNCWHVEGVATYLDGTPASAATWDFIGIGVILSDGAFVEFFDISPTCSWSPCGGCALNTVCAFATIDVNGFKKPNIYGYDIFRFYVTKNGFVPTGAQGDYIPDCYKVGTKYSCTAQTLLNN